MTRYVIFKIIVHREWLPTSNYEKIDGAEFEIYGGTEESGYIELWYPVVKKLAD